MGEKEIYLTLEQQEELKAVVKKGVHKAREITRARVLLMLDRSGKSGDHVRYKRTAEAVGISRQAVYDMRNEFLANPDITSYLTRKKRETPPRPKKLNGEQEAKIIALACSKPPEGYSKWSIRLLTAKAIELQYVDKITHTRVYDLLKKHNLSLT